MSYNNFLTKKRQVRVGITWRHVALHPTHVQGISVTHLTKIEGPPDKGVSIREMLALNESSGIVVEGRILQHTLRAT